jgi:hypothetical protein
MNKIDIKEIITVLWQSIERDSDPQELVTLWNAAEKRIISDIGDLTSLDLSLLVWSFGHAKTGSKDFWANIEKACLQSLAEGEMQSSELARVVKGLAQTEKASGTFWERLNKRIVESQEGFNAESISLIISGYGDYYKKSGFVNAAILDALKTRLLRTLVNLTPTHHILCIEGFSKLEYKDNEVWNKFDEVIMKIGDSLTPSEFLKVIQGFAALEKGTETLWKYFTRTSSVFVSRNQLTNQELSVLIWSFATIKSNDENIWKTFAKTVTDKLDQFKGNELVKIIWSFAYSHKGDKQEFWQKINNRVVDKEFEKEFKDYDYHTLLWSISESKSGSHEFWTKMQERINEIGKDFTQEQKDTITQLLYSNFKKE